MIKRYNLAVLIYLLPMAIYFCSVDSAYIDRDVTNLNDVT